MDFKSLFSWRGCLGIFVVLLIIGGISDAVDSCSSSNANDKFQEAMEKGNLTEAKAISQKNGLKYSAYLQLIKAYLDAGDANAAIDVYENITPNHEDRRSIGSGGDYSSEACKLLREYLMKHGQYEKAWNYYPLNSWSSNENDPDNAQSRFAWMSDVVSEMCKKGRQDDARSFVDDQLRWFVTYIDGETGEGSDKDKAVYGSEVVRQKLYNQIDNVH